MDADIFRDLKQLDQRVQKATRMLEFSAILFDRTYSENVLGRSGNYSWPYSIDENGNIEWPNYPTPSKNSSPLTNALCGWGVAQLVDALSSERGSLIESVATAATELRKSLIEVSTRMSNLRPARLASSTFKGLDKIFLHAQILRFLASQGHWNQPLVIEVFEEVQAVLSDPPKKLHPFYVHYSVLAIEQIRTPANKVAGKLLEICDLLDKFEAPKDKTPISLPQLTVALDIASGLRDEAESFETLLEAHFRETIPTNNLQSGSIQLAEWITKASEFTLGGTKITNKILSDLETIIIGLVNQIGRIVSGLPSVIRKITLDREKKEKWSLVPTTSKQVLRNIAELINIHDWYEGSVRTRVTGEIVSHISYAASRDVSRLDIGALAYSLAAALRTNAIQITDPLVQQSLSLIFEYQRDGRWRDIQPMSRNLVGFVHLPLNLEIANAFLGILLAYSESQTSQALNAADSVMEWVSNTINTSGSYRGWCSEHDYQAERIDLWASAQVVQFLVSYREVATKIIVDRTLEQAGLSPISPTLVSTRWKMLSPTDLEKSSANQLINKLKDNFVRPYERFKVLESSALLLYGPPGTSKTSLMEAAANRLGWNFLQISPADFLTSGGDQVEARATLIFEILKRAKNIVVLFDEVDELLLDREAVQRPQGIFRFMTTSMLPKLQSLRSLRRIFFGITTNYKERLDKAITRLGRVDFDWAVLPPDFVSRSLLVRKFNPTISDSDARTLAANTMFFSYLELKKTVKDVSLALRNPRQIVKHPTASPEAYENRTDSDDEFQALLTGLVTEQATSLATTAVTTDLFSQLDRLKKKSEIRRALNKNDPRNPLLFLEETEEVIQKALGRLKSVVK